MWKKYQHYFIAKTTVFQWCLILRFCLANVSFKFQANIHTTNQRNILTQAIQTHLKLYFCILITLDTTKLKEFLRLVSCFQERKGSILSLLQSWVSIGVSLTISVFLCTAFKFRMSFSFSSLYALSDYLQKIRFRTFRKNSEKVRISSEHWLIFLCTIQPMIIYLFIGICRIPLNLVYGWLGQEKIEFWATP